MVQTRREGRTHTVCEWQLSNIRGRRRGRKTKPVLTCIKAYCEGGRCSRIPFKLFGVARGNGPPDLVPVRKCVRLSERLTNSNRPCPYFLLYLGHYSKFCTRSFVTSFSFKSDHPPLLTTLVILLRSVCRRYSVSSLIGYVSSASFRFLRLLDCLRAHVSSASFAPFI